MLTNKLKVKSESLSTRCEVCHQADYFNAETGICSRCVDQIAQNSSQLSENSINPSSNLWTRFKQTPTYFKIFATLLGLDALVVFVPLLMVLVTGGTIGNYNISNFWYQHGLHNIGNIWSGMVLFFAFMTRAGHKWSSYSFRGFGIASSLIVIIQTIAKYAHFGNRLDIPPDSMVAFHSFQWVTGIVWPLIIIAFSLFVPENALPAMAKTAYRAKVGKSASRI